MSLYRLLSALLSYPEQELLDALPEIDAALAEHPWAGETLEPLTAWLGGQALIPLQETYVATFDRNRSHSLHLFEHVHGESRDPQAMVDLLQTYRDHGFEPVVSELPDHVPLFLEFLGVIDADQAQALLDEAIHVLAAIGSRLARGDSPYACLRRAARPVRRRRASRPRRRCATTRPWRPSAPARTASSRCCARPPRAARTRCISTPRDGRPLTAARNTHHEHPEPVLLRHLSLHCLDRFSLGSLVRFEREQYTWKTDSSQLLHSRPPAAGQHPVPRRHPGPVLRPRRRPADAGGGLGHAGRVAFAQADGRHGGRRRDGRAVPDRPVDPDPPPHERSAHRRHHRRATSCCCSGSWSRCCWACRPSRCPPVTWTAR